jgi:hypothetical protein
MQCNYQRFIASLIINSFLLFEIVNPIFSATAFGIGSKEMPKKLTAIVAQDNDLSLDKQPKGERVGVPKAVQQTIHTVARKAFENWKRAAQGSSEAQKYFEMKLNDVYGMVFRIEAPQKKALFIFQENGLFGAIFYHLILFDPHKNVVTQSPPRIYGKWMQGGFWGAKLLEPLISFDDLDQDGSPEIIIQERVHNGTMYNAAVYHYFKVGPDMSLHQILAMETRLIDLYTEDLGGLIIRRVTKLAPNQVKLETFLEVEHRKPQKLGETILIRDGGYSPFQISSHHIINPQYKGLLITGSEKDENDFLKTGYDFYY